MTNFKFSVLDAKELRASKPSNSDLAKIKRREIYIVCDNVLDTYNIGSIFRLADAVVAKCVYLCGRTETPPYHRISKAAVGTEKWVQWEYYATAVEAIEELRDKFSLRSNNKSSSVIASPSTSLGINSAKQSKRKIASSSFDPSTSSGLKTPRNDKSNIKIIAIEQSKKAVDFRKADYREPVAFVVGNETEGVSKEALAICDEIVEIPMFGVNRSLNVMVSLAIVLYQAIRSD